MQRLLVVLLAALDAAVAAAIGLAAVLAPLTLLWTLAFGIGADWGALWPSTATIWQAGHGAAVAVALDTETVRAVGIAPDAASFVISLAPLGLLAITLFSAARSGRRAARAGSWLTGVVAGTVAFALISAGIAVTGHIDAASTSLITSLVAPPLVYLVGAGAAAFSSAWNEGDGGIVDRLHDRGDAAEPWGLVPEYVVRGVVIAFVALFGAAGLLLALSALLRGGEVVALYEALRVDPLGALMVTLVNFAYLPTMIVWAIAWMAGPGFAIGTGATVSPVGADVGVIPGLPAFGLLPQDGSIWMLIVVLIPVAAGAFAGWIVRSRLVSSIGDIPLAPRFAISAGIAVIAALLAALLAALSSGSIGPGRLAQTGPDPWTLALALGAEVFVGAAILLMAPRHKDEIADARRAWQEDDELRLQSYSDRYVSDSTATGPIDMVNMVDRESTGGGSGASESRFF